MESQRSREHSFNTPAAAKLNSVKLFVGGLSGDITHDVILTYFRQFGEILEAVVIYEKRKPSGFGFINVGDQKVADLILSQKHQIGKSRLDVKPAIDRSSAKIQGLDERKKKVFVGGLPKNFPDDELQAYFVKFGSVQRCYVAKNPITGKTRGFGFVVFDHEDSATKVLEITDHIIGGQQVHLKFATDKAERDKEAPHEDHQDHPEPQEKQQKKDKKKPKDEQTPDDVGKSRNELAVLDQDTRMEQTSKSNPKSSEVSGGQSGSHGHKSKREKPIIKKLTLKDPKTDTDKAAKIPMVKAVIEAPADHANLEVGEEPRLRPLGNIKSSTNSRSFMSKPSNDSFLDTPTSQQLRSHGFPSKDGSLRDRNSVHAVAGIGPPLRQQEGFDYPQNQRRIAIQKSGSFQNSTAPSLHDQDRYPGIHAPAYQSPGMLEPNQYYHHEMGSTPQHPGHSFQYGYEQANPNPNYHQGKYFTGHSFNQNRQPIPNHGHRGGRSTRHPYGSNHAMNNHPQWPEAQNNPEIWNPANQMGYGYPQQPQPDAYPVYVEVPPSYENYDYGYNPPYASFPQDLDAYPETQATEPYTSDYYNPNMLGMAAQGMYQFAGYQQEPLVHKTETELSQTPASTSEPSQGNPSSNEMQNSGVHTGNGELGQQTQHPSFDSGEHAQKKKPDDGFYIHLASAGMPAQSSTDQPQGFGQRASAAMSQLANKPAPNSLNSTPTKGARQGVYMKSASKEFHRAQSKEYSQFVIYEHPHEENNPESNLLGAIEEVVDPAQEKALESAQRVIDAGTPLSNRFARPLNHQSSTEAHKPAEEEDERNQNLSPGGVDLRQAFALNRAAIYQMMTGRNAISGVDREGPQPIAVRNTQSSILMETKLDVLDMMLSKRDDVDQTSHHEEGLLSVGESASQKQNSHKSPDSHNRGTDSPFKGLPQFKFHQSSALVISVTEQAKLDSLVPKSSTDIGFSSSSGNLDKQPKYKENPFLHEEGVEKDASSDEELQRAEDI